MRATLVQSCALKLDQSTELMRVTFSMNIYRKALRWLFVSVVMGQAALFAASASAQSVELTAQQQQMLNQLPPAQREQALRQIELLQRQGAENSQVPGLSGDTTGLMPSFDLPVIEEEPEELRAERRSRVIVTLDLEEDLERQQVLQFERDPFWQRDTP